MCLRTSVTGFVGVVLFVLFTITLRDMTGSCFTRGRTRRSVCVTVSTVGKSARRAIDDPRAPCFPSTRLTKAKVRARRVTVSHVRHVRTTRSVFSLGTLTRELTSHSTILSRR